MTSGQGYEKICLYEEPYVTINGEGQFIGTPAVFIRTMGCHVGCRYCDAMPTWPSPESGKGMWYTNKQLTEFLDSQCANTPRLWLTGGEPTEHSKELISFIHYYKKHGRVKRIWHMITAGANFDIELMQELDCITIDIKGPSSGTSTPEEFIGWCMEDPQLQRKIDFKMVVDATTDDINFALRQIRQLKQFGCDITLQPMYWNDPEAKKEKKEAEKGLDSDKDKLALFEEGFSRPKNWKSYGEFAEHFMEIISYHNVRILLQLHKVYWPGQFDHI